MKDDPAFPQVKSEMVEDYSSPVSTVWSEGGLTKREFFAAMAMQGILSGIRGTDRQVNLLGLAIESLSYADALIKALKEGAE